MDWVRNVITKRTLLKSMSIFLILYKIDCQKRIKQTKKLKSIVLMGKYGAHLLSLLVFHLVRCK